MRILKPALLYFSIVFATGFVLGPIRIFLLIPRFGVRSAELMEMPVMLAAMIVASRWIVRRFPELSSLSSRLAVGLFALFLMIGAELSLVQLLQGVSMREYIASRDPVSGTVYCVLLVLFALLPAYWRINGQHP